MRAVEPDDSDFYRLFDAVTGAPWSVKEMVGDEPALVEATNLAGETVIHWFVVENDIDKVRLLHECGAPISSEALAEACGFGYAAMCELLLCFGVKPDINSCLVHVGLSDRAGVGPQRSVRSKVKEIFRQYGYPLTTA